MPASLLTKRDIADAQLLKAIEFYLAEVDLVCAVTLAGAAEEILGKLVEAAGLTPALHRRTASTRRMNQHLWGFDPGAKVFNDLKNRTKNELKHISSGGPLRLDLVEEAARLIDRAVENYRLVHPRAHSLIVQYERHRLARRRAPQ